MRYASALVAGLFAVLAAAQSSGSAAATTVASPTFELTPAQSSQAACIKACDAGDVNCQSHCITVPSPNDSQVNATTECAAKCNQGDGSPADTKAYGECVQGCIEKYYYVSSEGTPQATGGSGSGSNSKDGSGSKATATGSAADATGTSGSDSEASGTASGSGSGSSTGTASGSAASSSSTGNAAPQLVAGSISLLGLAAAAFAL